MAVSAFAPSAPVLADDDDDDYEVYDDWDDDWDDDDDHPIQSGSDQDDDEDDDQDDWDDDQVYSYRPSAPIQPEADHDDDRDDDGSDDRNQHDDHDHEDDDRERSWTRPQDSRPAENYERPDVGWKEEADDKDWDEDDDRYRVSKDDNPAQDYEVGKESPTGEKVEALHISTDQPIPSLARDHKAADKKEELYAKAKDSSKENRVSVQGREDKLPVKANKKTKGNFNSTRFIDNRLLNQEFLKLLNADRQAQGLAPLEYGSHLQHGTDTRARDLASIGDIRVNNQAHVRLDGSPYYEDFAYLGQGKNGIGENTAMQSYNGNPYELISEKALAEKFYQQWKASPGHYKNMMSPDYKYSSISVKMGDTSKAAGDQWNSLIAVQSMDVNP